MSIAMGPRLHINIVYTTTSVPIVVLLSQNAQSHPLAAGLDGVNGNSTQHDTTLFFNGDGEQCR